MSAPETDPIQATSDSLKRGVFVGVSAAATLATAAAVRAQEPLGRPHPPLVSENDPTIRVEHVQLERPHAIVPAYAAWPAGAGTGTPSVVVIMHIWGVDTSIRDVVRRYAKAGFAAIAPDLYARVGVPSGDGATDSSIFRPYAKELDREVYAGDIRAAALWLSAKFPATKIGLTGFCMGGHIAWNAAIDDADLFAVIAPFYGAVAGIDPMAIAIPVCGSFGGRDTSIPPADVRAFAAALTVPNDIRIYDEAGHAFFDDQRASYVASAADDAWRRTLACFNKYLR